LNIPEIFLSGWRGMPVCSMAFRTLRATGEDQPEPLVVDGAGGLGLERLRGVSARSEAGRRA
jgi:hypothetical protein